MLRCGWRKNTQVCPCAALLVFVSFRKSSEIDLVASFVVIRGAAYLLVLCAASFVLSDLVHEQIAVA